MPKQNFQSITSSGAVFAFYLMHCHRKCLITELTHFHQLLLNFCNWTMNRNRNTNITNFLFSKQFTKRICLKIQHPELINWWDLMKKNKRMKEFDNNNTTFSVVCTIQTTCCFPRVCMHLVIGIRKRPIRWRDSDATDQPRGKILATKEQTIRTDFIPLKSLLSFRIRAS